MAGKLHGVKEAIRHTEKIVGEIKAVKIVRALKSAAYIIRTESATMTPIDTSTLINSQYDTIMRSGNRLTARIGYSANYALYVHNASGKLKGMPRRNGNGNYWSPHGEPAFLDKAAEKTRGMVNEIIKKEMKL